MNDEDGHRLRGSQAKQLHWVFMADPSDEAAMLKLSESMKKMCSFVEQAQEFAVQEEQEKLKWATKLSQKLAADQPAPGWEAELRQAECAVRDALLECNECSGYPCPFLLPSLTPRCAHGHVLCKVEAEPLEAEDGTDYVDAESNAEDSDDFHSVDSEPETHHKAVHLERGN